MEMLCITGLQKRFGDDNIEILEYSIQDIDDFTKPVKETIKFTQQLTATGDQIYVNQLIFIFDDFTETHCVIFEVAVFQIEMVIFTVLIVYDRFFKICEIESHR